MASVFPLEQLRIICMRCPAEATLLLVEFEAYQDSVLIWCECHGEHALGTVDAEVLRRLDFRDPATGTVNIPMHQLRISREDVVGRRSSDERLLSMLTKRLEAFNHFLSVSAVDAKSTAASGVLDDC